MGTTRADQPRVEARVFLARNPREMQAFGEAVGRVLAAGDRLLLQGTFGTGKTTFVQGLARGLGVTEPVASPSFVLKNDYRGRLVLHHVDLYRLDRMDEALLEELEEDAAGLGVTVVEWPELLPARLKDGAMVLSFEETNDEGIRALVVSSAAVRLERALAAAGA